jgi:predicted benzoate:H+ symporter BenE
MITNLLIGAGILVVVAGLQTATLVVLVRVVPKAIADAIKSKVVIREDVKKPVDPISVMERREQLLAEARDGR